MSVSIPHTKSYNNYIISNVAYVLQKSIKQSIAAYMVEILVATLKLGKRTKNIVMLQHVVEHKLSQEIRSACMLQRSV